MAKDSKSGAATAASVADDVRAAAAKRGEPDREKFRRAKRYAEAAINSKRFRGYKVTGDGIVIHRFRRPGETVTGIIGAAQQCSWGEYVYPLVLDDDKVIGLARHKRLAKALDKADGMFRRVKITYKGKLRNGMGHHEKVYLVELA